VTHHPKAGIEPTPFYPILPDATWIERLVPLGIRTVQLRYKGSDTLEIRHQIARALEVCIAFECLLIVNDHWREALLVGAEYVHLGQEDLATADIATLTAREMRVGLSTHDHAELRVARLQNPDSIALGPIYSTSTKDTGRAPQGLARVSEWRCLVGDRPLTAIGGITLATAPAVIAAGADSVAVVSDVTTAVSPEARVSQWLAWELSLAGQ
jgi:thiamine-phosphate pyrophosphorylase